MKQFHYYSETLLIKKNKSKVVELGSVANEIYSGSEVTKSQLGTGDYPAVKCGDINSILSKNFKECVSFTDCNLIENKRYFKKGDVLFGAIAHSNKVIGTAKTYVGNQKPLAGLNVIVMTHNQNPKYLSFFLSTQNYRSQVKKLSQKSTVFCLYIPTIKKIQILLPSLEEQQQIVDKLDVLYACLENLKEKIPQLISLQKQRLQYYINKLTSC